VRVPFYPLLFQKLKRKCKFENGDGGRTYRIILTIILLQACLAFYPYVSGDYKLMNEYMDIPEETYLQEKNNNSRLYKNLQKTGITKPDPGHTSSSRSF